MLRGKAEEFAKLLGDSFFFFTYDWRYSKHDIQVFIKLEVQT
jgi:hypothetical protein